MQAKNLREITTEVRDFEDKYYQGKMKTFYIIVVRATGIKYSVSRRFNDFDLLNKHLKKEHGNLPVLPKKTFFPLKKPEEKLARCQALDSYLRGLVTRDDICSNSEFRLFMEVPFLSLNQARFPRA